MQKVMVLNIDRIYLNIQAQAKANQELEITKALTKPVKQQESAPNIDAAIGYNQLSSVLSGN
jgi:hypothetical protein